MRITRVFKSAIALTVASVLVPGGVIFAQPTPSEHAFHGGIRIHCDNGDCSNVDLTCMSHCVSSASDDRGTYAVVKTSFPAPVARETRTAPGVRLDHRRFARPGPEHHHSQRRQLLSVMKRE